MTDVTPTPATTPDDAALSRTRIEPSGSKRLDALPIVYVVGLVILAAALIYLWKHPSQPRAAALQAVHVDTMRQQIETLSAQVASLRTALDSRAQPVATNLAPLEAQVTALSAKVSGLDLRPLPPPTDLGPLDRRIAALESRPVPPPVDLGPLDRRVAALEAKPPVDLGPLTQRVDAAQKKEADDQAGLDRRLGQVEQGVTKNAQAISGITDRARLMGRLQSMGAALNAGQALGEMKGAPPALARFAFQAPPTESSLRLSFDAAAAKAHDASQPEITDGQPLWSRMWTRAQQAVTVRRGDTVLVGDPIGGVLQRARELLDAGDLAGAVEVLNTRLRGPAKEAMAPWVTQAQSLLDARKAIGELAAQG